MRTDWVKREFDACIEKRKAPTKLLSSSYQEKGLFPIVSQEKVLISGYWDNPEDLFVHKKPVVVFGDHTMVVKYIDFDFVVGADGVKILEPKDFLLPKFFFYWVSSVKIKSRGYARHYRYLRDAFVPVPSLLEQQRIVEILDLEFAKIDALKANAEKSIQATKDLFQATLTKELEPKDGWKMVKMGDYFRITSSKRVFQADWTDKGVPFYRAREIVKLAKYGSVDNDLFITPEMYDTYKKKYGVPKVGDILITGVGTLGVCFLVENETPFYFKDGNVIWFQKEKEISSRYVIHCYQTNAVKEQVHSTQGAVVGTYTIEKANATTIPLPPTIELQEVLASRLDDLSVKCQVLQDNYQKTLTLCDDLKQALLRKAFKGEL